uniref:Uncharacterized protein n=1 Tax=uncultured marine virus TaxID=186617 RepID=A0A0F7L6P3_9VIRU|nr:hypothetical protein [uncultured marine virus]
MCATTPSRSVSACQSSPGTPPDGALMALMESGLDLVSPSTSPTRSRKPRRHHEP